MMLRAWTLPVLLLAMACLFPACGESSRTSRGGGEGEGEGEGPAEGEGEGPAEGEGEGEGPGEGEGEGGVGEGEGEGEGEGGDACDPGTRGESGAGEGCLTTGDCRCGLRCLPAGAHLLCTAEAGGGGGDGSPDGGDAARSGNEGCGCRTLSGSGPASWLPRLLSVAWGLFRRA